MGLLTLHLVALSRGLPASLTLVARLTLRDYDTRALLHRHDSSSGIRRGLHLRAGNRCSDAGFYEDGRDVASNRSQRRAQHWSPRRLGSAGGIVVGRSQSHADRRCMVNAAKRLRDILRVRKKTRRRGDTAAEEIKRA